MPMHRRQMQNAVHRDRGDDRQGKEQCDTAGADLQRNRLRLRRGPAARHGEMHDRRRHDEIHDRRHEQQEEITETRRVPFCHTIKVVMSPNGLNAPPAFAATTMLMQESATKRGASRPSAIATAHMTSAVVRLSATGEMTEGEPARRPEQRAIGEAGAHQPGAQHVEDAPLLQRVDIGHRDQAGTAAARHIRERHAAALLRAPRTGRAAYRPPRAMSTDEPAATTTGFDLRRWIASSAMTRR